MGCRSPLYRCSKTCENATTVSEKTTVAIPLSEILHNIADHTETILHVINDPGVPGDVSQRMFAHILLEEKENTAKLEEIHGAGPTLLTQKLLDHSFFIQRMLQEQAMSVDLKRELLDHFMEEHAEWRIELLGPDAPPHSGGKPGVVSDFGTHQMRPSPPAHGGAHGAAPGGYTSHSSRSGEAGRSAESGRSDQKGKPGTAGATKKDWTVGPLWSQGG